MVVAKEGAADVKFSSVYASEDELLYTANIEYRVQWKLSPTLLRMMGLRFDVIVMQEVCVGEGGAVGETSAAEQVGALQEVMGHTVAFFEDYLAQYVEGRVGDDTRVDESETRPLMEEVRRWLRARGGGGGGGKQMSAGCTQAAAGTERKPDVDAREERQGTCGVLCVIGEGGSGKTSASIAIKKSDRPALVVAVLSPDASHVVACSNQTFRVWSMPTGKEVAVFRGHTNNVTGAVVTPDGMHVVSSCRDETVRMWKLRTGEETMVFRPEAPECVAVSPDGCRVVSGSWDGTVSVWDVGSGEEVFSLEHPQVVYGVAVTPDGGHVASYASDRCSTVHVWSMTTGEQVGMIQMSCGVCCIAVSPDGREIMCGCEDNTVRVWTICTGEDGTIDGLRLKRVIGVPPTVPRALGCRNTDSVEPELARRILLDGED